MVVTVADCGTFVKKACIPEIGTIEDSHAACRGKLYAFHLRGARLPVVPKAIFDRETFLFDGSPLANPRSKLNDMRSLFCSNQ